MMAYQDTPSAVEGVGSPDAVASLDLLLGLDDASIAEFVVQVGQCAVAANLAVEVAVVPVGQADDGVDVDFDVEFGGLAALAQESSVADHRYRMDPKSQRECHNSKLLPDGTLREVRLAKEELVVMIEVCVYFEEAHSPQWAVQR
jgi:hypothetical protein